MEIRAEGGKLQRCSRCRYWHKEPVVEKKRTTGLCMNLHNIAKEGKAQRMVWYNLCAHFEWEN